MPTILTQRIFFINDTTAVRMEMVTRSEWERLPGKPSLQEIRNMKRPDVVLTDSTVTLHPGDGEVIQFLSYDEMRPDGDEEILVSATYTYRGYLPGADMWHVDGCNIAGTAGYEEAMYIDSDTGKIRELNAGSHHFSPDGKSVFEYYQDGHDHDYSMGLICVQTGEYAIWWEVPESFVSMEDLKCVEWVSDSVLKLRFFDDQFERELTPYINALGYRVVYLTPFRQIRPNENHYY